MSVDYTFEPAESAPLDPGSTKKHKPKILECEFGNGYIQRAAEGPNNDPLVRAFSWSNLTEDEMQYIEDFLVARNGWQAFYYLKPNETVPLVYTCPEWDVTENATNVYSVTATFRQVFDI